MTVLGIIGDLCAILSVLLFKLISRDVSLRDRIRQRLRSFWINIIGLPRACSNKIVCLVMHLLAPQGCVKSWQRAR